MNREAVLFQLREGKEQREQIIVEMSNDNEYSFESFQVDMSHLYHHLSTAWNGRDVSPRQHRECGQNDFDQWRKFPSNADLLLD